MFKNKTIKQKYKSDRLKQVENLKVFLSYQNPLKLFIQF
jgi:hypothetical protein